MTNANDYISPIEIVGEHFYGGLTKREYFAAMAMQGLIANGWTSPDHVDEQSKRAVLSADALINELNK